MTYIYRGDAAAKAKERERAKAELAKKAGVPMSFQWPDKKVDIPLESTGSKEIDEEDAMAHKNETVCVYVRVFIFICMRV